MSMLELFKALIEAKDDSKDTLYTAYINKAQSKFLNYCHLQEMPDNAQQTVVDYAIVLFNRRGSEGLSSESYSGVNNTYETDIPADIKSDWNTFRKVQLL